MKFPKYFEKVVVPAKNKIYKIDIKITVDLTAVGNYMF